MKKVFSKYWPFLIIFFASLYPFYLNSTASDTAGMFNLRDSNTPFDPASEVRSMLYVWKPNWGLGYPNFGSYLIMVYYLPLFFLRSVLGLSLMDMVKAYLTMILVLLGIGAYFFLTRIFIIKETQNKKMAGVLGSLFYMFNIPTSQRFIGVPHTAVSVALFPLILLMVDKLFFSNSYRKTIIYSLLLSLLSVFFYASDPSLAYLFSLFIFIYIIFILLLKKKYLSYNGLFLGFFLTLFFSFTLNLYWILPIFNSSLKKSFLDNTAQASYNIDTFERSANTINSPLDVIRLHWTKNSFESVNAEGEHYYPSTIRDYYRLPFSYLAFIILLSLGVWVSFSSPENRKTVSIITVMGALSLMFSFGKHAPFGFWAINNQRISSFGLLDLKKKIILL